MYTHPNEKKKILFAVREIEKPRGHREREREIDRNEDGLSKNKVNLAADAPVLSC